MSKLGIDCKVYFNTATYGTPTWLEINSINDWKEDASWNEADASSRACMVDESVKTSLKLGWSGTVKRDGSEDALAVAEAFLYRTPIDCLILDGDKAVNGSEGYRLYCQVHQRNNDQGRNVRLYDEIMLKPAPGAELPKRATVASGALAYAVLTGVKPA